MSDNIYQAVSDKLKELAEHERTSSSQVLGIALNTRIELVRDYAVFATALSGLGIALLIQDSQYVKSPLLLIISIITSVVAVIASFLSRQYYIDDGDNSALNIENKFARAHLEAEYLAQSKSTDEFKEYVKSLPKIDEKKTHRPGFFKRDIVVLFWLIIVSAVSLILSLFIQCG